MTESKKPCPDCSGDFAVDRRRFLATAGAASAAVVGLPRFLTAAEKQAAQPPETLVKKLYDSLNDQQRAAVCFAWDHQDPQRGLLRTRI